MKSRAFISTGALLVGACVLLIGISLSLSTWRQIPQNRARFESKLRDLNRLQELEQQLRPYTESVNVVEKHAAAAAIPIPDILKRHPILKPDDIRTETEALDQGWQRIRTTVSFGESPIREIMRFVDTAAATPNPWKLARCEIRASARDSGNGQVTIQLEQLRKPQS